MWTPVETQFYRPQVPVSVVLMPNSGDGGPALRGMLEMLNCAVLLHRPGTPSDFLKILVQGQTAPRYMILYGHGQEDGLWFGTYVKEIDTSMLRDECLPPDVIRENVRLPGCTVVSSCCYSGLESMGQAFLSGDVAAYIGCRAEPDGVAMNVFLVNFLFSAIAGLLPDRDAWRRAATMTDHEDIWQLSYFADGDEERLRQD